MYTNAFTLIFRTIAIVVIGVAGYTCAATSKVELTADENQWIADHPTIRVAPDPDFLPIERLDENGMFTGIAAEYMRLVENRLGIKFTIVRCKDWDDVLSQARTKQVDMLSAAAQTPQREEYLSFSSPHIVLPGVIITRADIKGNLSIDDLKGKKVGIVSGYVWQEFISRDHPEIVIDPVSGTKEGLMRVSFGSDFAFVENVATATYTIEENGITNLRVVGETGYYTRLSFAVRKDWPQLVTLLEKALLTITPQERKAIQDKWIKLSSGNTVSYRKFMTMLGLVFVLAMLVIGGILFWNYSLKRQVSDRTKALSESVVKLTKEMGERKRVEDALRASEKSYREIYNGTNEAIFIHDACTVTILDVNQTMCEMFGYTREEASHLTVGEFSSGEPPYTDESAREWVAKAFTEGPQLFEWRGKRKNGELFWIETNLKRATIDGKDCIIAVVRDITERKRDEMALSESERRYRFLFDGSPAGSVIIGPDGLLVDINKSFEQSLGYGRDEIIGRPAVDFIAAYDRERVAEVLRKRFGGEKVSEEIDTPVLAKDGSTHYINFAGGQAQLYDGEKFIGVLITGVDVTERRKAEELARQQQQNLIQADKMASLGILVSGVAHEINNPNNYILLNSENLQDIWKDVKPLLDKRLSEQGDFMLAGLLYSELHDEIGKLISGISQGTERIQKIVQNLKDFARHDTGAMDQLVDMNSVIESAVVICNNLIHKSTDNFVVEYFPQLPKVRGNFQQLEQVIINLVTNACHAITEKTKSIQIKTAYNTDTMQLCIAVNDQGKGISAENMSHIMDPFFTTKRDSGGTGLGLSISYSIIKDHSGELKIESEQGVGTQATLILPAVL